MLSLVAKSSQTLPRQILHHSLRHSPLCVIPKRTLVTTPEATIKNIYPEAGKIIQVANTFKHSTIPTSSQWTRPSAIKVFETQKHYINENRTHYFVGGISALMQAIYKLFELGSESPEKVVYTNDGKTPISLMSGHQGHVHPTEHTSDDCRIPNLVKTMFQGAGVLKEPDPNDLENYSYLHFPISLKDVLKDPKKFVTLYGSFFKHRLVHDLKAKNGVSQGDRWLCEGIRKSLEFHEMLSKKIESKTGLPTFKRGFRIYWSKDREKLEKKMKIWQELDIPCEWMTKKEIMEHTLLRIDKDLHVLKVIGDGNFFPETPQRIIDFALSEFPNFSFKERTLQELHLDKSKNPSAILERDPKTNEETLVPITSFFCSPGHNEVFKVDPFTQEETRLFEEKVPVSGITSLWHCTIPIEEIQERFDIFESNHQTLLECAKKLVASANLSNLHITPISTEISADGKSVVHLVRGTQGANFNRTVANHKDLKNMCVNLNSLMIGDWELLSVGTCTRQTSPKNHPELDETGFFLTGGSGIGYSASAMPPDWLRSPEHY